VVVFIDNVPIVVLNTCLGGTEYAIHGMPGNYWDDVRAALKTLLSGKPNEDLLDAMDIPAIGNTQLDAVGNHLREQQGNCAIILGHHPPLPTHNSEVRPYATLVDSGQFIYRLISNGHRILYLHGHTHCSSSLVAHSPENFTDGFFACIGDRGLFGTDDATATYIQVITHDNGDFGAALVYRYQKSGASIRSSTQFELRDVLAGDSDTQFDITPLGSNKKISFANARKILRIDDAHTNDFALDLLRHHSQRQVSITNLESPPENWNITRNQ
jgi:hypothetical protein